MIFLFATVFFSIYFCHGLVLMIESNIRISIEVILWSNHVINLTIKSETYILIFNKITISSTKHISIGLINLFSCENIIRSNKLLIVTISLLIKYKKYRYISIHISENKHMHIFLVKASEMAVKWRSIKFRD